MAKAYIKEKYAKPAGVYLGIPHRLDRPVSAAWSASPATPRPRSAVHAQFQDHKVRKVYWALVEGDGGAGRRRVGGLDAEAGGGVARRAGGGGRAGAKLAMLEYRVLKRLDGAHAGRTRPADRAGCTSSACRPRGAATRCSAT